MAFVIDDTATVTAKVVEVVAETTGVAADIASSSAEITAKDSASGIDMLNSSEAKFRGGVEILPEINDVVLGPTSSFNNSSVQTILPEKSIFVDDLSTNVESTSDVMQKGELFVDEYQPNIESQETTSLESNPFVDEYPVESDIPVDNVPLPQESVDGQYDVETIEQKRQKRDTSRFSEKNQYATSEQIQEYRSNPKHGPLLEDYEKDADVLRNNMEKVMGEDALEINKSNSRAHHIVGDNEYSGESKAILEKYGIDINAPENGIFLPQDETSDLHGTIHSGKHTMAYNDEVTQRLKVAACKEDVLEILDSIKEDLYNGDIELYNNHKYNV